MENDWKREEHENYIQWDLDYPNGNGLDADGIIENSDNWGSIRVGISATKSDLSEYTEASDNSDDSDSNGLIERKIGWIGGFVGSYSSSLKICPVHTYLSLAPYIQRWIQNAHYSSAITPISNHRWLRENEQMKTENDALVAELKRGIDRLQHRLILIYYISHGNENERRCIKFKV